MYSNICCKIFLLQQNTENNIHGMESDFQKTLLSATKYDRDM